MPLRRPTPTPRAARGRTLLVAGAALVASGAVAGCGGVSIGIGGASSDPTSSATSTEAPTEASPSSSEGATDPTGDAAPTGDGAPGTTPGETPGEPASTEPTSSEGEPTPSESDGATESDDATGTDSSETPSPEDGASEPAEAGAADSLGKVVSEPSIPHRGEAFRWESGLVAHVTEGEPFIPSPAAAGTDGFSQFERYEVTLTNRSPESFRLSDFRISAQSAGEPASRVFDSGNGINSQPAQDLEPGETARFPVVFGVKDPQDTVLDVVQAFELSDRVVFLPPQR